MIDIGVLTPLVSASEIEELFVQCQSGKFVFSRFLTEMKSRMVKQSPFHNFPSLLLSTEIDTDARPFGKEIMVAKLYGIQRGMAVLSLDDRISYHAHLSGFLSACDSAEDETAFSVQTYFIPRVVGVSDNCHVSFSWRSSWNSSVRLAIDGCGVAKTVLFSDERARKLQMFLGYFLGK